MQPRAQFGLRTGIEPARKASAGSVAPAKPTIAAPVPELRREAVPTQSADAEIERENKTWNSERKLRRRALREPWRSVSIVAGIGFGLSNWLLPDSVAAVADLVTAGLSIAAFAASLRQPSVGRHRIDTP